MREAQASEERELDRLRRFATRAGPRFGLGLGIVRDPAVANELRVTLSDLLEREDVRLAELELRAEDDRVDLVARMQDAGRGADVLFVTGLDRLLLDGAGRTRHTPAVANLNQRRDSLPEALDLRVVFWLSENGHRSLREQAWDLRQIMMSVAVFERRVLDVMAQPTPDLGSTRLRLVAPSEVDSVIAEANTLAVVANSADPDTRAHADAALSAGSLYASAGSGETAADWLERASAAYDRRGELDLAAQARAKLGQVLLAADRGADAIDTHQRALEAYEAAGLTLGQELQLQNLGATLQALDEVPRAIEAFERALELARAHDRREQQAALLGQLGACYRTLGVVETATELFEQALAIAQADGMRASEATQHANLGVVLQLRGQTSAAIGHHERALAICNQLHELDGQAAALSNLGACHWSLGDVAAAVGFYERALAINLQLNRLEGQAVALGNLGLCHRVLGALREAIDSHQRSLSLYEELGQIDGAIVQLGQLGWCHHARGDFAAAQRDLERARTLDAALAEHHLAQYETRLARVLVGRYRLLEICGRSPFATVWRALDEREREVVAVKLMHRQWLRNDAQVQRFLGSGQKMQALRHPAIVPVLDVAHTDGEVYMVMKWFVGGDLHQAVRTSRVDTEQSLAAIADILDGLIYAHRQSFIHRDVKPANILLDEDGHGVLTAFDLTRAKQTTGTRIGTMGTFVYAAPDSVSHDDLDERADVYSAGMCVLFALTGDDPPPLIRPEYLDHLPCRVPLRWAIAGAIAYERSSRTTTCEELAEAIRDELEARARSTDPR